LQSSSFLNSHKVQHWLMVLCKPVKIYKALPKEKKTEFNSFVLSNFVEHTNRSIVFSESGGSNRALMQNHGIIIQWLYRAKISFLSDDEGISIIRIHGKRQLDWRCCCSSYFFCNSSFCFIWLAFISSAKSLSIPQEKIQENLIMTLHLLALKIKFINNR
jgi:hypothetical protein